MKTLKLVMIAAIVSFAMMSYADNLPRQTQNEKIIKITLNQAMADRGLVGAMYAQLTPAFLQVEQPGLYKATVRYKHKVIEIHGTKAAWVKFFRTKPGPSPAPIACQD